MADQVPFNHWSDLSGAFNLSDPLEYEEYLQTIANLNQFYNVSDAFNLTTLSPAVSTAASKLYCGDGLETFSRSYRFVHGYISLVVCLFGMLANTLNIVVLTRMDQHISATNAILTGLAVADNLVMIEYIPFAFHMYILGERPLYERFSYPWTVFVLFHAHVTQVFHTISIWLTLLLAVWRYISVAHPLRSRDWCTLDRALMAILLAYICSPIVCIPIYLVYTIQEKVWQQPLLSNGGGGGSGGNSTDHGTIKRMLYVLGPSELAEANDGLLKNINFWTYSVVVKLIPCVALTILSFQLIRALVSAKERRQNLKSRNPSCGTASHMNGSHGQRNVEAAASSGDRTTRMLLAVLFLFLLTEFPQGILALLSGILGDDFFNNCYRQLNELMDILALINGAINFILYCVMSSQFRDTFHRIVKPILPKRKTTTTIPLATVNSQSINARVRSSSVVDAHHTRITQIQETDLQTPSPVIV